MRHIYSISWYLFLCMLFHMKLISNPLPIVLVSVAPHQFFVEQIAQQTVAVQLMVPPGASAHTYEPTPRQMMTAAKGELWFTIGEPFEARAKRALLSACPQLNCIDLQQGVDLIRSSHGHCCRGSVDLHFWLSARQAAIQAQTIADTLSARYPTHASLYQANLNRLQQDLSALDREIHALLAPLEERTVLVSHPAYAYFCRDYALEQQAIEIEGKDPLPQQMTRLLEQARRAHIKTIFVQKQYNHKAATLMAAPLQARLVTLDPYSYDYFNSMREIAHAFARK